MLAEQVRCCKPLQRVLTNGGVGWFSDKFQEAGPAS